MSVRKGFFSYTLYNIRQSFFCQEIKAVVSDNLERNFYRACLEALWVRIA